MEKNIKKNTFLIMLLKKEGMEIQLYKKIIFIKTKKISER